MPIAWIIALGLITVIFLSVELYAHFSGKFPTLSGLVWIYSNKHRNHILPFVAGVVVGVLMMHFWGAGWCAP